jgi:sulfite exporter TauE/SafE
LPWLLAAFLIAGALAPLGWARALRLPARLGGGAHSVARAVATGGPTLRAAAFGALTPLLPCGLLYGVFLAAAATGTALSGGGVMLLFALGGVPALAGAQAGAQLFNAHPRVTRALRTAVPLAAAAVLIWRALASGPVGPVACH